MTFFEIKDEITTQLLEFLSEEEQIDLEIEKSVLEMASNIRKNGFASVAEYSKKFDKFDLTEDNFRVSKKEIEILSNKVSPKLSKSLEVAIERVKTFHEKQKLEGFSFKDNFDNTLGQKIIPLDAVAIYSPGGRALYPSTIYMSAIPAKIAGVKRIVLASPPRTFAESAEVARLIEILEIDEVYRIGGAQAILSCAYGLHNLAPVDKIAGPGNIFVAKAKQLVYGKVDIDMIAGPSEILIIADSDKEEDIPLIAADLLSQAEHDPMARSILVGVNKDFLLKIEKELYRQANTLPENLKNNALESLNNRGLIVCCDKLDNCIEVSNKLAPEHLEIFSYNSQPIFDKIKNAGSVFIGRFTPESVGDYIGGPNHILPTGRTARFFSPLGVYSFQKRLSFIEFSQKSLANYCNDIAQIARAENLEAHARSAEIRITQISTDY
ncbi:MAG: histidinol dehydrogenase [Spirochaetes bacterium GWD1_27_9]|nr:MAG: histidinol dehydrogenase [Spirochaetes bacterium GWB1_27_13]OHD27492.1 MAG: histidinol dehydrogenase [Spirochaetes bacterium GWC1_27_15]OHD41687.1 MAG: histidinol dehydrogenase [Spirochaetes bacterium GWD1_27_9]